MRIKFQSALACLGLVLLAACAGGGSSGGSRPHLGESTKPGYFPDGSKAEPLTDDQIKEFAEVGGRVSTVTNGVSGASNSHTKARTTLGPNGELSPAQGFNSIAANNEKVKQIENSLKRCNYTPTGQEPTLPPGAKSGTVSGTYGITATGTDCAITFDASNTINANVQMSAEDNFTANGSLGQKTNFVVKNENFLREFGVKSAQSSIASTFNVSQAGKASSMSTQSTTNQTTKLQNGSQEIEVSSLVLVDLAVSSQSANGNGKDAFQSNVKMVLVFNMPNFKVLFQMFQYPEGNKQVQKIYLNGKDYSEGKLRETLLGIQNSLASAEGSEQ